ncbi:putative bicarbonate transporter, IctB family [Synechococcales cyanobacterium C]|uniref:Putative bicarbonate transporter, IctB family n=1 Tax=Petrachloros mirabilis ULC683 TaxID=2781853 RepID=A0A8K2AGT1_9CYAN|nr:IctB family putative bicarbonate transporter [Petrachloros mirabilis]NCJ05144.1 putative bicarbonate transporter, IctB family [Petrachloros mirabilis ULC683]
MNGVWQQLTLMGGTVSQWHRTSWLGKGQSYLNAWRQDSLLLQRSPWVGGGLVSVVLASAPFVPNSLTGLLLVACGGLWLLLAISDAPGRPFTPIHGLVALYWLTALIATGFSPVKMAAAAGLAKLTLYLFLFALAARVLRSPRWRQGVLWVYLFTAAVVVVYGIRQWFFGAPALATWVDPESSMAGVTRVYSYLGNPNLLAAYLVPAVPLSVVAGLTWRPWGAKLLAGVLAVSNTLCLVLTFSRGGWIGLVVAGFTLALLLLYWLLPQLPKFWQTWAFPVVLGSLFMLLGLGLATVAPLRDRVLSMFAFRADDSNNFRINVWQAVLHMIRDYPWTGIGPGNTAFNQIYPRYQRPSFSALGAYSIYLELLVELGVLGFGVMLALLATILWQGVQALKRLRLSQDREGFWLLGAIAAIAGMLAHGIVDTVWYRPEIATLWWLLVALVTSYGLQVPEPIAPEPLNRSSLV